MPNHVTNILRFYGSQLVVDKILASISSRDERGALIHIDFKKIVPMPATIYEGPLGSAEEAKYGKENCWYDWSVKNWGTKWNAYNTARLSPRAICFDTAWSAPMPIYEALRVRLPDVRFIVRYADEDVGYNFGILEHRPGEKSFRFTRPAEEGSLRAVDFSRRVRDRAATTEE
jgi:hypothetical protein